MKQRKNTIKPGAFIAAFCIVIYLFAIVQAATRLILSVEQRKDLAAKEFESLKELAISTGQDGFMDARFVQIIDKALQESRTLEAVIITGADKSYPFEKKKDSVIIHVNNAPRFANRFGLSNATYYETMTINNLRNVNIKAKASAFDYDEILKILKDTLLFILVGFGISFFTMLIQLLVGKSAPCAETSYENNAQAVQTANQTTQSADLKTKPESEDSREPKGLYSPRSSIGWEEYTKDRLDAEIHRCASTEKDLSFISIEFSGSLPDTVYKKAAEEAVSVLSSKDMLFENGPQGIYAILPGVNLEAAIAKSEKYYQRVMQMNSESDPNIGITSRSGRLLNADRLILEAGAALKKAKQDETTSIIAFKSDPEKYRTFVSQNS